MQARMQMLSSRHAAASSRRACRAAAGPNGASAAATAPRPAVKAPAASPAAAAFTNINKFLVPPEVQPPFLSTWRQREADMRRHSGFLGLDVEQDGEVFTVSSSWASIPEWEEWSLSAEARRSHLPWGIYQFVPKKGEGFPEDFIPFEAYDEAVNAKY